MTGKGLVLGGGGVTGVAWEVGLLAGLADQGLDLRDANVVVGTSAGAVVGAQLTSGASLSELYELQRTPGPGEISVRFGMLLRLRYGLALVFSRNPDRARRRLGRIALALPEVATNGLRAVIESLLLPETWPEQAKLMLTAVDAQTGEATVFDRASGVSLVDAVVASCAVPGVWPSVPINGRLWMDGGMRSATNADLAAECERVVVLAPVTQGFRSILPTATQQCAALAKQGRAVALLTPDQAAAAAIGPNMLDDAHRAPAAEAGYVQAAHVADDLASVWAG